jgi:hypothetical protein
VLHKSPALGGFQNFIAATLIDNKDNGDAAIERLIEEDRLKTKN